MRRMLAALAVLALAGCGCGDAKPPARERAAPPVPTGPRAYAVAYAVPAGGLAALARRPLPQALEQADVVARSEWGTYHLIVLSEWLHEHGVDLDRPRPPGVASVEEAWDTVVVVITAEHARRYRRRLARLRPPESELRAYFEAFNEESRDTAGEAMLEYLAIVRTAMGRAAGGRVVVIPIDE